MFVYRNVVISMFVGDAYTVYVHVCIIDVSFAFATEPLVGQTSSSILSVKLIVRNSG